jgi:hypothetical protein
MFLPLYLRISLGRCLLKRCGLPYKSPHELYLILLGKELIFWGKKKKGRILICPNRPMVHPSFEHVNKIHDLTVQKSMIMND